MIDEVELPRAASGGKILAVGSRNLTILGRRTSIRLEDQFWQALQEICQRESTNISEICSLVALVRSDVGSLSSAVRAFVLEYFRAAATPEGHARAGHGGLATMIKTSLAPGSTTSGAVERR